MEAMNNTLGKVWSDLSVKEATLNYINHVYKHYCKDYDKGSDWFGGLYNVFSILTILFGFVTAVLAALLGKEMVEETNTTIRILIIILPILSSTFATLLNQYRIKEKYQLRENARVRANHYYTTARRRFAEAQTDNDFSAIHKWLSDRIYQLQVEQVRGFFIRNDDNEG